MENNSRMFKFNKTIGFIGAGNMAQAIGLRILSEGLIKPSDMIVSARSEKSFDIWRRNGAKTTTNNSEVVHKAEIVFIAVKPQFFEEAIDSLNRNIDIQENRSPIFVSIMAGKSIEYVEQIIASNARSIPDFEVIRVMPNTPCFIGKGCSAMCHKNETLPQVVNDVRTIMECTGSCFIIPEKLFDATSAICGSGPAYIYMVIEALADGAVRCGVPRDLALSLASQTVVGAGEMVIKSGKHPGQLKDEVCSPGGTTITAVHELEKAGLRCAFMNAVQAATNRSQELSSLKK